MNRRWFGNEWAKIPPDAPNGSTPTNLRFSTRVWESPLFASSGFYTNRIGFDEMTGSFRQAGFSVEVTDLRRWKRLPIARRQLADEFRDIPQDTLRVCGFDVLLRKAASPMENIFCGCSGLSRLSALRIWDRHFNKELNGDE